MGTARQNPNVAREENSASLTNYIHFPGCSEGDHAGYKDVRTIRSVETESRSITAGGQVSTVLFAFPLR